MVKELGAVLHQEGHPIAFISKALGPRNQGLLVYEKECLAILFVVEQWRPYIQHAEFIIRTDQKSLIHLEDQRLSTPWQQKALTKLMGLQFKIQYKRGTENKVIDALSRRPDLRADTEQVEMNEMNALTTAIPIWIEQLVQGYQTDEQAKHILADLMLGKQPDNFALVNGIIKFKGKIFLGNNKQLQQKIMQTLRTGAMGGHSGFPITYR